MIPLFKYSITQRNYISLFTEIHTTILLSILIVLFFFSDHLPLQISYVQANKILSNSPFIDTLVCLPCKENKCNTNLICGDSFITHPSFITHTTLNWRHSIEEFHVSEQLTPSEINILKGHIFLNYIMYIMYIIMYIMYHQVLLLYWK